MPAIPWQSDLIVSFRFFEMNPTCTPAEQMLFPLQQAKLKRF